MFRSASIALQAATLTTILLVLSPASAKAESRGAPSRGAPSRGAVGVSYRGGSYNGAYRGGSYYRGGAYNSAYRGGSYYRGGAYYGGSYYRSGYGYGYNRGSYGYPGVSIGIGLGLGYLGNSYLYDSRPAYSGLGYLGNSYLYDSRPAYSGLGYLGNSYLYDSRPAYIDDNSPTYIVTAPARTNTVANPPPTIINQPDPMPPAPADDVAMIRVHVHADADLWFNGAKTAQRGDVRDFASPQLTSGKEYSYELRARWTEDGVPVEKIRRVAVHANDKIGVDFNQPESVVAPTPGK